VAGSFWKFTAWGGLVPKVVGLFAAWGDLVSKVVEGSPPQAVWCQKLLAVRRLGRFGAKSCWLFAAWGGLVPGVVGSPP
jgi:hypothetical protein